MTRRARAVAISTLATVLALGVGLAPAGAGVITLHLTARHAAIPVAVRVEPVAPQRASVLPRLGETALTRIAGRLATLSAEARATGGRPEVVDRLTARTVDRTRCQVVNRTFMVPRGFVDQRAIDDRIHLEAAFHDAQVTGAAEWSIQPTAAASAPQFSRVVVAVFLSACPRSRH
jgi:hypothetical protein